MVVKIEGKNGISVTVLADSIALNGKRMTSFEFVYHRLFHSEAMTHRLPSKNASSTRAVPLKKAVEYTNDNPAVPVFWGKNKPGMMATEPLVGEELKKAQELWELGRKQASELVLEFEKIGLHKQIAGRPLETYSMIKVVCSGTDWGNLLWLRDDEEAQPEFAELAACIREALKESVPVRLHRGEWHLPYIDSRRDTDGVLRYYDSDGNELTVEEAKQISASCCAQVSYRNLNESKEKAIEIYHKLVGARKKHASPFEHQATPIYDSVNYNISFVPSTWEEGITHVDKAGMLHSGNLTGWIQHRQLIPDHVHD